MTSPPSTPIPDSDSHLARQGAGLQPGNVLYIGTWWVEWLVVDPKGRGVHTRQEVEGEHPADFARAALAAIKQGGLGKRPCVLALSETHAPDRRVEMPALKRAEERGVLHRKAAQLLGVELDEALFSARPARASVTQEVGGEPQTEPTGEELRPWVLVGLRKTFVRDLLIRLRRHGVPVRRVVPARFARLSTLLARFGVDAESKDVGGDRGTVVIDVELHSITVHLAQGTTPITHSVLSGSIEESPGLGVSLLQEVRGLDAYWRKLSRGGRLARVIFVGLGANQATRLSISLETALPGVDVHFVPENAGPGLESGGGSTREHSLAACSGAGVFDIDLTVQLPRRPAVVGFFFLVSAFLAGSAGVVAHQEMSTRLSDLEGRALALREATTHLPELRERSQAIESDLRRIEEETERARAARAIGLPLTELFGSTLEAFGGDAELTGLSVTRTAFGHELLLSGSTRAHPLAALRTLLRMESELSSVPFLEGVALRPPTLMRADRQTAERLPFEFSAQLSGFLPTSPRPETGLVGAL